MSKKIEFRAKDFQKFHQKDRCLDAIVLGCKSCQELKTHIYLGKDFTKHIYRCLTCGHLYVSSKKLEEYNMKNLK